MSTKTVIKSMIGNKSQSEINKMFDSANEVVAKSKDKSKKK